jgi:phospholipid/cholesterol/gamma-HCH transport system substrate-binding protein
MLRPLRRGLVAAVAALAGLGLLPACAASPKGAEVTAYFDRAVSLYPKGDVKILGLSSGKISAVDVVGTQVRVRMRLNKGITLPADVHAAIVPQSLIGERYVQLFPAWVEGHEKAPDGVVIPRERTSIPVEPDQALAALKKFLDALDPHATGRLIHNLADDLRGNGQTLNDALGQFAQLSGTLADKDQQLAHLVDNFDQFTATLNTRDVQLAKVMDEFATTTRLLADERDAISRLVDGLAKVSQSGLSLVTAHGPALNTDVATLTRLLESVNANIDNVRKFLTATPELVSGVNLDGKQGLAASYDPAFHHIDLRQATSPTLALLLQALGLPVTGICLPIDVTCPPGTGGVPLAANRPAGAKQPAKAAALPAPTAAPASVGPARSAQAVAPVPASPIDAMVGLLDSPGATDPLAAASVPPPSFRHHRGGVLGWARQAAHFLAGALS